MLDPRDPLGLEALTDAMHRLSRDRRELIAFYLFTAALVAMALLLAMFR